MELVEQANNNRTYVCIARASDGLFSYWREYTLHPPSKRCNTVITYLHRTDRIHRVQIIKKWESSWHIWEVHLSFTKITAERSDDFWVQMSARSTDI